MRTEEQNGVITRTVVVPLPPVKELLEENLLEMKNKIVLTSQNFRVYGANSNPKREEKNNPETSKIRPMFWVMEIWV